MADMKEIIISKIGEIVEMIKKDEGVSKNFASNPVKTVEGILGVDLPDEAVMKIVDGVKAKISGGDKLDDIIGSVKNLLGK